MNVLMQMSEMSISKLQFGYGFHRLWSFFREISCVFHSLPFDLFKEDIHLVFPPGVPPSRSTVLYRLYDS